jgi:hypothetical protein
MGSVGCLLRYGKETRLVFEAERGGLLPLMLLRAYGVAAKELDNLRMAPSKMDLPCYNEAAMARWKAGLCPEFDDPYAWHQSFNAPGMRVPDATLHEFVDEPLHVMLKSDETPRHTVFSSARELALALPGWAIEPHNLAFVS